MSRAPLHANMFSPLPDPGPHAGRLARAALAAVFLHLAGGALLAGRLSLAVIAGVTGLLTPEEGWRRRDVVLSGLAIRLLAGVWPHVRWRRPQGGADEPMAPPAKFMPLATAIDMMDSHRGVILWPERDERAVVAPPKRVRLDVFSKANRSPLLTIPFYGPYWYFRSPDHGPPPNAHVAHGSPDRTRFRSTDHRPMQIEAHQHLGSRVDLSCCGRLIVNISNADRYPGTVRLEVILTDTGTPGRPAMSLGEAEVTSTMGWRHSGDAVAEDLTFSLPSDLPAFDEITVRFRMSRMRADTSPRIAIRRFTLVPR